MLLLNESIFYCVSRKNLQDQIQVTGKSGGAATLPANTGPQSPPIVMSTPVIPQNRSNSTKGASFQFKTPTLQNSSFHKNSPIPSAANTSVLSVLNEQKRSPASPFLCGESFFDGDNLPSSTLRNLKQDVRRKSTMTSRPETELNSDRDCPSPVFTSQKPDMSKSMVSDSPEWDYDPNDDCVQSKNNEKVPTGSKFNFDYQIGDVTAKQKNSGQKYSGGYAEDSIIDVDTCSWEATKKLGLFKLKIFDLHIGKPFIMVHVPGAKVFIHRQGSCVSLKSWILKCPFIVLSLIIAEKVLESLLKYQKIIVKISKCVLKTIAVL